MATELKVFVKLADAGEGRTIESIHRELIDTTLYNEYPGEFEYFSYYQEEDGSFVGRDAPEGIKKEATAWNSRIDEQFKKAFDDLSQQADFSSGEAFLGSIAKGTCTYWSLHHFISAMNQEMDHFQFGQHYLVYDEAENEFSVRMPEEMVHDAIVNPEDYAVIEVYYH